MSEENMDRHTIKRGEALMLAAEATLLFHGGYWTPGSITRWEAICGALLIPPPQSNGYSYGATAKQLCNIVRAAMEGPESSPLVAEHGEAEKMAAQDAREDDEENSK